MIKMSRNLLLIKLDVKEKITDSIVLPEDVRQTINDARIESATKGTVKAFGPDCEIFEIGDSVLYPGYIGNQVKDERLGEGVFVIVAENDILMGFDK